MIRRSTLILFVVFLALVGLAVYLQRNPLPTASETATPSPTETALLLEGWLAADITRVERQLPTGETLSLTKNDQGSWTMGADSEPVEVGVVEQVAAELTSLRPGATLDPGIDLEAIGMTAPEATIVLGNGQGQTVDLRIGAQTPTGSGYYVQVGNSAPAVVDKFAIDGILELLQRERLVPQTAEPEVTPTPG